MSSSPAISVSHLSRDFRIYEKKEGLLGTVQSLFKRDWQTVHAVDDISFSINAGEFVGFLGPNGAGKTTTLKMLSGILSPTRGECDVFGFTPFTRDMEFKRAISMVMGQKSQLIWDLPATDTFALHRDMYQIDHKRWKETLRSLTDLLRVEHILNTPVRQLSLGERMKCEIILSLLHEPKVLFLDEPTIGLDVISQKHLWDFLRAYQQQRRTTIMLTSHNMQDISNLCSRIIIINTGKLIYDGTLEELVDLTDISKKIFVQLGSAMDREQKERLAESMHGFDFRMIDEFSFSATVPQEVFSKMIRSLLEFLPIENLEVQEMDFSAVMTESFSLSAEEIPLRKLSKVFSKRVNQSLV